MAIKVGIFYNTISNPTKFSNKTMLMENFSKGVSSNQDTPVPFVNHILNIEGLSAGFILGYTLENNFRKHIITLLEKNNITRVFVDSNILNYANPSHEWHRYSLNSVYPSSGQYFFTSDLDYSKWDVYRKSHNVKLKPYRKNGNHILLLCQRSNGWNLFGNNQDKWVDETIYKIRQFSDRPIRIRLHPNDSTRHLYAELLGKRYGKDVKISLEASILDDFKKCWCTVGYNSTPNVVSHIEGIPNIITDPYNSWAKDVSDTLIQNIEDPTIKDRTEWLHKIANIHWSNDEIKSGKLWSMIRRNV